MSKIDLGHTVQVTQESTLPQTLEHLRCSDLLDQTKPGQESELSSCTRKAHWYRHTEQIGGIASNAKFNKNIVIVSQQDHFLHPLAVGIDYTIDGGKTWNRSSVVLTRSQGPTLKGALNDYEFTQSPKITSDVHGNFYILATVFNRLSNKEEALIMIKSTDGACSWIEPIPIIKNNGQVYASIHSDPDHPEKLYVVWTDISTPTLSNKVKLQSSKNGGRTWSSPLIIGTFQSGTYPETALTFVNGGLLMAIYLTKSNGECEMIICYSEDGEIWGHKQYLHEIHSNKAVDPVTTEVKPQIGSTTKVQLATNEERTVAYLIYADSQFNPKGQAGTVISMSKNEGRSWKSPAPINPAKLRLQTFGATISVLENGLVGVLYYDFTKFNGGRILHTDVWLSLFDSDLDLWYGRIPLTDDPFDTRQAPQIEGNYDLVEIPGLIHIGNTFGAAFNMTNEHSGHGTSDPEKREDTRGEEVYPNRLDIYFRTCRVLEPNFANDPIKLDTFR